jgi:hypothetical protein
VIVTRRPPCRFTTVRAALDSLISDRADYDGAAQPSRCCTRPEAPSPATLISLVRHPARGFSWPKFSPPPPPPPRLRLPTLRHRCLAVGSSAALLALLLHVFLQLHYARTTVAQNQQAYELVAAKKRAERARMMEERQRQVVVREQHAADAAEAAAAHEAAVRREYTALREELRIAEVVPDRHMTLASMEQRIDDMKQERVKRQELRLQQQAAHALRIQQQQQAAAAAAELEAQKPKPATRQVCCCCAAMSLRPCDV